MTWNFEQVAGPFAGPLGGVVDVGDGMLFSSVADSRILKLDGASGEVSELRRFSSRANGLARGPGGELYACQEGSRRVVQLQPDGSATITAVTLNGSHHNHPSDAVVDSRGRIWFTDPHHEQTAFGPQIFPALPHASVLRLERGPNHRWLIKRLSFDTLHPRALALSPDEKTLYVAEGNTRPGSVRELRAYPIEDDLTLGTPDTLMSFGADPRGPHRGIEGLCVAADGHVLACGGWQRSGEGPCIYVLSPQGKLVEVHALPDDAPARCAFGGANLASLYVTSGTGRLWRADGIGHKGLKRVGNGPPAH
ncbi:MAG: gluconolactonase [Rhizobacter sp.]|nr:gluconolactonase [Rhizobacter sp.]